MKKIETTADAWANIYKRIDESVKRFKQNGSKVRVEFYLGSSSKPFSFIHTKHPYGHREAIGRRVSQILYRFR